MSYAEQKLFVIGLPRAGKTTFLAALWHVVEFREVPESLRLVTLEGDKTHLNQIRSRWIDAEPLERTRIPDEKVVSMLLADEAGQTSRVWIPDLSGESLEAQWTDRVASADYEAFVRECSGGILFVHPAIRKEHLISEVEPLIPTENGSASAGGSDDAVEVWNPHKAPTQVQLVDILQSLVALTNRARLGLVVAVSAWDVVPPKMHPADWIKIEMPLLYQYLMTHQQQFECSFFGISAQGGDLSIASQVEAMRDKPIAAQRLNVVGDKDYQHDITAPIRWLMTRTEEATQ